MHLKTLVNSAGYSISKNFPDFQVKGITSDSRKVRKDFIFVAVKGSNFDGHSFINEAILQGAKAIVTEGSCCSLSGRSNVAYINVSNSRQALARLTAQFYGQPSLTLKVVGITGTNGKTTVSYLIEAILKSAGLNPAVIGTVNYRFKAKILKAANTTPDAEQLQLLLNQMQREKVDYVVIEVSSHALDQARVEAINFSSAIFTNLTSEHLDYHRDLNSYFTAKSKLFSSLSEKSRAILNMDDKFTPELIKLTKAGIVTYGIESKQADIIAEEIRLDSAGGEFFLRIKPRLKKHISFDITRLELTTSLIGKHNIYNLLAAAGFALVQGIKPEVIKQAIEGFSGVPGRLEKIRADTDFSVYVDYAHTEDALTNVIRALRSLSKGRILVVFGCGGNRDRAKRPKMGRAVSELADLAIITTDNPRDEEPEEIINEIVSGINKQNFKKIVNRKQAIKEALSEAGKDDIILIAGKGHENCQIFKDRIIHFDDREVVRECLGLGK